MSIYKLADFLVFSIPFILGASAVIIFYYYKMIAVPYKILGWYLIAALFTDLLSKSFGKMFENNLIFIPVFALVEIIIFSLFYFKLQLTNRIMILLACISVVFVAYEIIYVNVSNVNNFQVYSRVVSSFLITVFSISYCFKLLYEEKKMDDERKYFINSLILFFYAFSVVYFLPIGFLINEGSDLKFYFWIINTIITSLFYMLLTAVIWTHGKNRKRLLYG